MPGRLEGIKMDAETLTIKRDIINSLRNIYEFLENNKAQINPNNSADIAATLDSLETKLKESFVEEDKLTEVLTEFEGEYSKQEQLVEILDHKVKKQKESSASASVDDIDQEEILRV
jgi:predicted RND superfamily exporter protein